MTYERCCLLDSGQSRRYKTFVANGILEIHQKSNPQQWRHVTTDFNCADDATRGLHASQLNVNPRWFRGPEFLYHAPERWPQKKRIREKETSEDCQAEIAKPKMTFASDVSQSLMDPSKYSSWIGLISVTAWAMRFVSKLSTKVKKRDNLPEPQMKESLTPAELDEARKSYHKGDITAGLWMVVRK